jgi:hypothetical protein
VFPVYAARERGVRMMQASIATVQERFSSNRMVRQYFDELYACRGQNARDTGG